MRPATPTGLTRNSGSPYRGLSSFGPDEAAAFFGRADESSELRRLWQAHRVTVLYGPAGSGKTSLLAAGVIASLIPTAVDHLAIGVVGTDSTLPRASLLPHNPLTLALLSSWSPAEPPTRLASLTVGQFLRRRPAQFDRYGHALPVLACIDQAEDLFTGDPAYSRPLMEELWEALSGDDCLHLLLSVREDHLSDLAACSELSDFGEVARLRLGPLTPSHAVAAASQPAQHAGRAFAPGAAEALIDELRGVPGTAETASLTPVEPALLQVVCADLWAAGPAGQQFITIDDVRPSAVDQALADFAGQVLSQTADEYGVAPAELHAWIRITFDVGVAVAEGAIQTAGMPNAVVRRLQDWHLLRAEWIVGVRTFRLQHDRLAVPVRNAVVTAVVPFDPARSLQAAQRALRETDFLRAERHASKAAASGQEIELRVRAEATSVLGNIKYAQGSMEAAAADYRQAAALFDVLHDTEMVGLELAAIGRVDTARGRYLEAIDAMQSAVDRIPVDLGTQTALAQSLWEMGKDKSAISILDGVLGASGDTPEALRLRAEIFATRGNTAAAQRDRKLAAASLTPRTRAARALAIAAARELHAATREIEMAVDDAPDDGPVLLYAAQVQILRGDQTAAADMTRRALAAQHPPLARDQREQASHLLPE